MSMQGWLMPKLFENYWMAEYNLCIEQILTIIETDCVVHGHEMQAYMWYRKFMLFWAFDC